MTMIAIGDAQLITDLNQYYLVTDEEMPLDRIVDALIDLVLNGISN